VKKKVAAIFVIAVIVIFTSQSFAWRGVTKSGGYAFALTEELLDKFIGLAVSKDKVAMQKMLDSGLVQILKGGVEVEVTKTKVFSGKVRFRPIGYTQEFWTTTEAIQSK